MKTEIKCVHCGSKDFVKEGFRKTKNIGKIQKYRCHKCHKIFTNDDGFYRMRNNEKIITMSIDMYLSNLSSRKMRNQLKRHMETKISHVSVLDWVRKYVLKVNRFVEGLKPVLSGKVYADETEIPCQRRKDIFWCSVDWDTRFINATLYSPHSQNLKDATAFMKEIKAHGKPKYIQTDAGVFYPSAFRKVFNPKNNRNFSSILVDHRINNVSKTGKHNVRIETVFMKIKDRVKDFRGFKALWSATILMAGIILQHNFIEAHTTTNKLPCELASLNLEAGVNRWLGLIRLANC
ncbi:MAG: DDE-type integrase/transposase/recombinase [Nanoarchaeota archaeon]|nr:DDE-type integrase/transposase/recombinase [Nanoarchaeota archaeon]